MNWLTPNIVYLYEEADNPRGRNDLSILESINTYFSVVSVFPVSSVSHNLRATIRHCDTVLAAHYIAITVGFVVIIILSWNVVHLVLEIIWHSRFVHVIGL